MMDNEMSEDALDKFSLCLDNYYRMTKTIPIEPILFKVLALLRISLTDKPILNQELLSRSKILVYILELFGHYHSVLKGNYLAQYYQGLVLLLL